MEADALNPVPAEPVGLLAAAKQAPEPEPGPSAAGEQEPPPASLPWRALAGALVEIVFERLAASDAATWTLTAAEKKALTDATADYLETLALRPSPLTRLVLTWGMVCGPRLVMSRFHAARTVELEDAGPRG